MNCTRLQQPDATCHGDGDGGALRVVPRLLVQRQQRKVGGQRHAGVERARNEQRYQRKGTCGDSSVRAGPTPHPWRCGATGRTGRTAAVAAATCTGRMRAASRRARQVQCLRARARTTAAAAAPTLRDGHQPHCDAGKQVAPPPLAPTHAGAEWAVKARTHERYRYCGNQLMIGSTWRILRSGGRRNRRSLATTCFTGTASGGSWKSSFLRVCEALRAHQRFVDEARERDCGCAASETHSEKTVRSPRMKEGGRTASAALSNPSASSSSLMCAMSAAKGSAARGCGACSEVRGGRVSGTQAAPTRDASRHTITAARAHTRCDCGPWRSSKRLRRLWRPATIAPKRGSWRDCVCDRAVRPLRFEVGGGVGGDFCAHNPALNQLLMPPGMPVVLCCAECLSRSTVPVGKAAEPRRTEERSRRQPARRRGVRCASPTTWSCCRSTRWGERWRACRGIQHVLAGCASVRTSDRAPPRQWPRTSSTTVGTCDACCGTDSLQTTSPTCSTACSRDESVRVTRVQRRTLTTLTRS